MALPHGLYFARLSPASAERVVDAYERGVVDLENYRGRSGEPFPAQAAEFFLRQKEGLLGLDDLLVSETRRQGRGLVQVRFDARGSRSYEVRVQVRLVEDARPLSCNAAGEERPPTYELVELRTG